VRAVPPVFPKDPRSLASVKGLPASGPSRFAVTSTKSNASTLSIGCENETLLGAPSKTGASANIRKPIHFDEVWRDMKFSSEQPALVRSPPLTIKLQLNRDHDPFPQGEMR